MSVKISELPVLAPGDVAAGDVVAIVDSSEGVTKQVDLSGVLAGGGSGYLLRGAPILITESGTYTPDPEVKAIYVEVQAAGGAGGRVSGTGSSECAYAGGAQAGGYCAKFIIGPTAAAVVIGAGAIAMPSPANGGASSYDDGTNVLLAGGGESAPNRGAFAGGSGFPGVNGQMMGAASGGDINITGEAGGPGINHGSSGRGSGGRGGNSKFGTGGPAVTVGSSANGDSGLPASGPGAAGSGAGNSNSQSARNGGDGADGLVVIWEFI